MAILIHLWHRVISVALSQSFPPKRGGKARPQTRFQFTVQKKPLPGSVPGTSGASLPKRPHLENGNEAHPSGKKSAGGSVSTSSAESRKGGCGCQCSWCARALNLFILLIIYICNF